MTGLHTTRGHWTQWVPDSHAFVSAEDNVAPQLPKPYQLACEMLSPDCLALNRTSWISRRNQSQSQFLMSQKRRYEHWTFHMKFHIFFHLLSVKCHHTPIDNTSNIFANACSTWCMLNIMLIIKIDITKYIENPEERPVYNFQITELLEREHQWFQHLMYKWDSIGAH